MKKCVSHTNMQQPPEAMKVIAFLSDIGGTKVIVECIGKVDEKRFAFLLPPEYSLREIHPFFMVQAAITKHGYVAEMEKVVVRGTAALQQYVALRDAEFLGADREML